MKDRKPFELKNTLIIYNIVQVILSVILVIEVRAFGQQQQQQKDDNQNEQQRHIGPLPPATTQL